MDRKIIEEIVTAGMLAPTGDNCQPFRFVWDGSILDVYFLPERAEALLDVNQMATYLALGAVLANIKIASKEFGYEAVPHLLPDPFLKDHLLQIQFNKNSSPQDPLYSFLRSRCVNRRAHKAQPLDSSFRSDILRSVEPYPEVFFSLFEEKKKIRQFASFFAETDAFVFANKLMHHDLFQWMRFSSEEVEKTRDGMGIDTLELDFPDRFMLKHFLVNWRICQFLGRLGIHSLMAFKRNLTYRRSTAIGFLAVKDLKPAGVVLAGELLERIWLQSAKAGYSFQPMIGFPLILIRARSKGGDGLTSSQIKFAVEADRKLSSTLPEFVKNYPLAFFRIGRANPPSGRTLRMGLDNILQA